MGQNQYFPHAFFEGKIIPVEEAKVSIMTNALQYGTGIFTGIRGYLSKDKKTVSIFRLEDHFDRFLDSLRILNKTIRYSKEDLMRITLDLVKRNNPKVDCYIRPFAYAADYEIVPDMSKVEFDVAIYMLPLGEYLPISRGLKICVSSWTRINDNMIPVRAKVAGGYVNSSLAKAEAANSGFDDALMVTMDGHISEASAANFFIVRDGILVTAPKHTDALEGITRRTIIELSYDLKIKVEERDIDRTETYIADEAFLSGTGVQLAWIKEIDGRVIGNGEIGKITDKIQKLYFRIVRGEEKAYQKYLTKVC